MSNTAGLGALIYFYLIFGVIGIPVGAFILQKAVEWEIGEGGSYWTAAGASFLNYLIGVLFVVIFYLIDFQNFIVSTLVGLATFTVIIKQVYHVSMAEALKIWLYNIIIAIGVAVVLALGIGILVAFVILVL